MRSYIQKIQNLLTRNVNFVDFPKFSATLNTNDNAKNTFISIFSCSLFNCICDGAYWSKILLDSFTKDNSIEYQLLEHCYDVP